MVGFTDVFRELLDRGADVRAVGMYGADALQAACTYGHVEVARLLLDRGAAARVGGAVYLLEACKGGHDKVIQLLLDRDQGLVHLLQRDGMQVVCERGHVGVVRLLH